MDCTRTSGFFREMNSLSLMGFADRLPIVNVHLTCEDLFGFCRPRSDLFCHHEIVRLSNQEICSIISAHSHQKVA